ncbi:hypothetical protein OXIME_001339 [Oxyplasma meridianum]|uniref:Uncharacterized protein n=1 Tax=Oxyplasma meridianum TaxID=3073602 RepID=A0AAX4NIZ0_9ARCH
MNGESKVPSILGLVGGIIWFLVSIALVFTAADIGGFASGVGSSSVLHDANSTNYLSGPL